MLWDIVSWPVRLFGGLPGCWPPVWPLCFCSACPFCRPAGAAGSPKAEAPAAGEDAPGSADIRTPDGSYALTGEVLDQLPPDSVQLGVLFQEGADSRTGLYAARREHAGCILWAAPGGDLYLQLSGGGYARACPEPG